MSTYRVQATNPRLDTVNNNGNIILTFQLIRIADSVVLSSVDVPSGNWTVAGATAQAETMVYTKLRQDQILAANTPQLANLQAYLAANTGPLASG